MEFVQRKFKKPYEQQLLEGMECTKRYQCRNFDKKEPPQGRIYNSKQNMDGNQETNAEGTVWI